MGLRIHRRAHQLQISRARGAKHGRGREHDEASRVVLLVEAGYRSILTITPFARSPICLTGGRMMNRVGPNVAMIKLALIAMALIGCQHWRNRSAPPPVLLFDGTGSSRSDVAAIESLLAENGLAYETASSSRLDEMGEVELAAYRLLIIPGGDFE